MSNVGLILNIQALNTYYQSQQSSHEIHVRKVVKSIQGPQIFKFVATKTIDYQIDDFKVTVDLIIQTFLQIACQQNQWNGKILFEGFKGVFKLEYWSKIEESFRSIKSSELKRISFSNTKLDNEHLKLLLSLIQWVSPFELALEFKHNELDDQGLQEFIIDGILDRFPSKISSLEIISNPGIYKGNLLKQIKKKLKLLSKTTEYDYKFYQNEENKTFAYIRLNKNKPPENLDQLIAKFNDKIKDSFYYKIQLKNTFKKENHMGLYYLLEQSYHNDKLEQLELLDISACEVGETAKFQALCQRISTSKGLLHLGIGSMVVFQDFYTVQALMGDRYDKLRLNHLDISNQSEIVEKCMKIFADNIIASSLKSINWNNSMGQHLPVLVKIMYICHAVENEIEKLKEITIKNGRFAKLNMQELDLSNLDNYNRHDLVERLLAAFVFNEHSDLRYLVVQNFDVGRLKAYLTVCHKFKMHIKAMKKLNPNLYKKFKLKIHSITLPKQTYRMEIDLYKQFFEEFVFTTDEDILQILNFKTIRSFHQTNREEGLTAFLNSLDKTYEENPDIKFTLKSIWLLDACLTDNKTWDKLLQNVVFNEHFKIEEFIIEESEICLQEDFLSYPRKMISELKPDQYCSLNKLQFVKCTDYKFQIFQLIDLILYNQKFLLKEIILLDVLTTEENQDIKDYLLNRAKNLSQPLSLKKLKIGNNKNLTPQDIKILLQVTVLTKYSSLTDLELQNLDLTNVIPSLYDEVIEFEKEGFMVLSTLKNFVCQFDKEYNSDEWQKYCEIFIWNQRVLLNSLTFKSLKLESKFEKGFESSYEKLNQIIMNNNILIEKFKFHLTEITFQQCAFEAEFMAIVFTSLMCKIEKFNLIECTGIEFAFKELKRELENAEKGNQNVLTMSLTDLRLDKTIFTEVAIFEWFLNKIVLNKERQRLTKISFEDCQLKDEFMQVINKIFKELKDYQNTNNFTKYFSIRDFNFNNNKDISVQQWKAFVNNLFTAYDTENEDNVFDIELEDQKGQEKLIEADKEDEQLLQEQQDLQGKICEDTHLLLYNQKLNIEEKLLQNPKNFQLSPPKNLKKIEINLLFDENNDLNIKKDAYIRIMKGFVFFPDSQIEEISFKNVNLNLFTESIQEGLKYLEKYYQKMKSKVQINLSRVKLSNITEDNEANTQLLVQQFFMNQYMNIQAFNIYSLNNGKIHQKITDAILECIDQKREILLEELILENNKNELSEENTLLFFQTLVFNQKVPLKTLTLDQNAKFKSTEEFEFKIQLQLLKQNSKLQLKEIQIALGEDDETNLTFQRMLPLLFNPKFSQLENFQCKFNKKRVNIFSEVKVVEINNFTLLNEINIQGLSFDSQLIELIYNLREQLIKATFTEIDLKKWDSIQVDELLQKKAQNKIKEFKKCVLCFSVFSESADQSGEFLSKFVFNDIFNWTQVFLNGLSSNVQVFAQFEKILNLENLARNLQILRLDMNLLYNSGSQLSNTSLEVLGRQLIYNENSNLKELIMKQCHLKPDGIKSLTSAAKDFRERVKENNQMRNINLKLERFSLYYSLYIGDEGAKLISSEIIFFEYITIKRIELEVLNWNDENQLALNAAAKNWLQFQESQKRASPKIFQIEFLSLGRNEFVQNKNTWNEICDLFIFSDLCPKLVDLHIQFMSIQDNQIDFICNKAKSFFMWKPFNYVHPLRRLNFCQNSAPSHWGWRKISKEFFFEKHVRLEQLNLNSTMIDSKEKIDAIIDVMKERAKQEKTGKLPLHTIYCFNISIKANILNILSQKPPNYNSGIEGVMVSVDESSANMGQIDGIPQSFGQRQTIITKTLYQANSFTIQKFINDEQKFRFSPFHLDLVQGFLRPLNIIFKQQAQLQFTLPINIQTIDQLCALFNYNIKDGDPYPIQIFFEKKAIEFYNSKESFIREIKFLSANLKTQEIITQEHVFKFWKLVRSNKNTLDNIEFDYKCDDDLVDLMFSEGYSERDFVDLIRLFPPTSIRFQKILTLQAIKGIYSVMWDNNNFQYSNILVDKDIFLNMGIGYSLREYVYSSNPKYKILKCFKRVFYWFFDLFVRPVQTYEFSDEIKDLNKYLAKQNFTFIYQIILTLIFYSVCICAPLLFTYYSDRQYSDICHKGVSQNALYTYGAFAGIKLLLFLLKVLFLLSELVLFKNIAQIIPKFTILKDEQKKQNEDQKRKTKEDVEIDMLKKKDAQDPEKQNLTKKLTTVQKIYSGITDISKSQTIRTTQIYITLLFGQLAKYNLYNQVSFILTCYYCMEEYLFYAALAVGGFNFLKDFSKLLKMIISRIFEGNNKAKQLSTKYINDFFIVNTIGRNITISQLLDQVAPYNITVLPNNFISKTLMPQLAGKSISNSVRDYLLKFTFEDMPQIILQIIFLIVISSKPLPGNTTQTGGISVFSMITIANSSFSLLLSFIKFMSIRPSSLSQKDFDDLAIRKKKNYQNIQIELLQQESEIIKALTFYQPKDQDLIIFDENIIN